MATSTFSPPKRSAAVASITARQMHAAAPATPLDYSFMGLASLSEMVQQEPVGGKKKEAVGSGSVVKPKATTVQAAPSAVSLRVNNNKITTLDDMDEALSAVFDTPTRLQWLDLSGNALTSIPPTAFMPYSDIFTLHLHGNQLSKYTDVDCLSACLPRLHSLTLHGNPLEEKKHYKSYVIASFPQLRQLDFSSVTRGDRTKAETWAAIYKNAVVSARTKTKRHGGDDDRFDS